MNTEKLLKDLEDIISAGLKEVSIPYQRGNSIRIKNYAIRTRSNNYMIFDCRENRVIAVTNFRISAIAIAKNLSENKDYTKEIIEIDEELSKHYNDALFYRYTIKNSKNHIRQDIRKSRLECSLLKSEEARQRLENFIYI